MNRFVIIGGSGFVGRHLLQLLSRQQHVAAIGTTTRKASGELVPFDLTVDDVRDVVPPAWRQQSGGKWAIICSAVVPMDRCVTEAEYARAVMLDGTRRCIAQLVDLGFTPVFISTSYVFDGREGGYRETDSVSPQSEYGKLKVAVEDYLLDTCPIALIARLDKVVGSDPGQSHLFTDWFRLASEGRTITCIRDQQFGPTLVKDIALVLYRCCLAKCSGIYHVANPEPVLRTDLAERVLRACGLDSIVKPVPLAQFDLAEPRPLRSWLNADKVCGELGFSFTPVEAMLRQFAAHVR